MDEETRLQYVSDQLEVDEINKNALKELYDTHDALDQECVPYDDNAWY